MLNWMHDADLNMLKEAVLAALFSADKPLSAEEIVHVTGQNTETVRVVLDAMADNGDVLSLGSSGYCIPGQFSAAQVPDSSTTLEENILHVQGDGKTGTLPKISLATKEEGAEDLWSIPLVEIVVGKNGMPDIVPVEQCEKLPGWYIKREYGVEPRRLCSIKIRGDSMNAPPSSIAPGVVLKAAILPQGQIINHGAIYIIVGPHGLQLKRIYFKTEELETGVVTRRVCLWSDNETAGREWIPLKVWLRDYIPVAIALKVENSL